MKRLFYFFIDGLGLGEEGPDNHVSRLFSSSLGGCRLLKNQPFPAEIPGGILTALDAVQGVKGIPQSATGQTSLYTGVNAQKVVGYHLTAFPNTRLMRLLREHSLLKRLVQGGISVTSANLYSQGFFEARSRRRKNMFPASTLSIKAAGIPFRMQQEYLQKKALFADITNRFLKDKGYPINLITPEDGARRIVTLLEEHQAVFFEYFMTDIYGHKRNREALEVRIDELNRFLRTLLDLVDEETAILITSDHGNVEDFSSGNHTLNPVPLIFFTPASSDRARAASCRRLVDVYPLVLDYFGLESHRGEMRLTKPEG